jgi:transposase
MPRASTIASQTVVHRAPLWAIEEVIRSHDPAARVMARQEKSAAIVAALFKLWERRSAVRSVGVLRSSAS